MAKFTAMKERFCDNILSGLNQEKSAADAGYAARSAKSKASQLLKEPEIMEYIQAARDRALEKSEITATWILNQTKEIIDTAVLENDHRAALKGLEMLGRNKKLWTDVQEHKFDITQMGRVMIKDGDTAVALEFNVGQEPNQIEDKR